MAQSDSKLPTVLQRGFVDEANAEFAALEASVSEAQAAADTAQKEAESMQVSWTCQVHTS